MLYLRSCSYCYNTSYCCIYFLDDYSHVDNHSCMSCEVDLKLSFVESVDNCIGPCISCIVNVI